MWSGTRTFGKSTTLSSGNSGSSLGRSVTKESIPRPAWRPRAPRDILRGPMEAREAEDLLARIRRDGAFLAARFGLRYRVIEAERPRVRRRYGACYADGTIRIR